MALPATISVKLSSEAVGAVSITPVVVQELSIRELVERLLGLTGKDEPRIREILRRGTLVNGASRFRWTGWEADAAGLRAVLETFPDPDPSRPFARERCVRAILRRERRAVEILRDAAERKARAEPRSFWDVLMEVADSGCATYGGYAYGERADRYLRQLSTAEARRLSAAADYVPYTVLREQIQAVPFSQAEFLVTRPNEGAAKQP